MSPPLTDQPQHDQDITDASMRRRISVLQEEVTNLRHPPKNTPNRFVRAGRGIRRLVSLTARVEDLVNEFDRRNCEVEDNENAANDEQDCLFGAYKKLMHYYPFLRKVFESQSDVHQLASIYVEMNKSADQARADDTNHLKTAVLKWIEPRPTDSADLMELLDSESKDGRGFDHELTGRLLCPVDYDWENPSQHEAICDYHPDFLVTAYSWPSFLYEGGIYDANNPSNGLFKGELLVTAFKYIFTSPSSASKKAQSGHMKKRRIPDRRTRAHVAARIGMKSVSPRAIAYIAVQLRFALSSCGTWRITDGEFDYNTFYNNIVDFFENTETPGEDKFIRDLLLWWNRSVFSHERVAQYSSPLDTQRLSVAKSLRKKGLRVQ